MDLVWPIRYTQHSSLCEEVGKASILAHAHTAVSLNEQHSRIQVTIESSGFRLNQSCVCVGVLVWPVAVDITKMISDRGGGGGWDIPRLVHGTLLSTIIQCYTLLTAFLYPPPENAANVYQLVAQG